MAKAAKYFLGEHDFTSFRAIACQAKHAIRNIQSLEISRKGDFVVIDITANAFLHHMVRNIVGTLMVVGQEEQAPEWVAELISAKDRSLAAATAPSEGLYLVTVRYPEAFGIPESSLTDWFL
jgi:tRNA pseudouridine38-40 synthase